MPGDPGELLLLTTSTSALPSRPHFRLPSSLAAPCRSHPEIPLGAAWAATSIFNRVRDYALVAESRSLVTCDQILRQGRRHRLAPRGRDLARQFQEPTPSSIRRACAADPKRDCEGARGFWGALAEACMGRAPGPCLEPADDAIAARLVRSTPRGAWCWASCEARV